MKEQERSSRVVPLVEPAAGGDLLPYLIELWQSAAPETVERVLGRAGNATVARAIYRAAVADYPERRITLRRGRRIVADSRA